MDLDNLTAFLASHTSSRVVGTRGRAEMLVDRCHMDALTCRFRRTGRSSGAAGRGRLVKRLFSFPELRDSLLAADFTTVTGNGEDRRPLTAATSGCSSSPGYPKNSPVKRKPTGRACCPDRGYDRPKVPSAAPEARKNRLCGRPCSGRARSRTGRTSLGLITGNGRQVHFGSRGYPQMQRRRCYWLILPRMVTA
jgi:hypothetical protein